MTSEVSPNAPDNVRGPGNTGSELLCAVPEAVDAASFALYGGGSLEYVPDLNSVPDKCKVAVQSFQLMQPIIAALQPVLTILDMVGTLVQCFLLAVEALTDPFKVPRLMACIPALTSAFNRLLALIPSLPQGALQVLDTVLSALKASINLLECISAAIKQLDADLSELNRLIQEAAETRDATIRKQIEELAGCAEEAAQIKLTTIQQAIKPVARLLCSIRGLLYLVPGGAAIADQLVVPNIEDTPLPEAAGIVDGLVGVLTAIVTAVEALAAPFGGLTDVDVPFSCTASAPQIEPIEVPELVKITDTDGDEITDLDLDDPDTEIWLFGKNLTNTTVAYFGTSELEVLEFNEDTSLVGEQLDRMRVNVTASLLRVERDVPVFVVNQPNGGVQPFGSYSETPSARESNQIELEVF